MFMKTLNDFLEYLLSNEVIDEISTTGKWSHHGSSIYEYFEDQELTDFIGDSKLRKQEIRNYLKQKANEIFRDIQEEDPEYLYRSVYTNSPNKLKLQDEFGIFWSSNPQTTPCVKKRDGDFEVLITIEYDREIINWKETLRSRIDFLYGDREKEYQLLSGKKVAIKSFELLEVP